MAAIDIAGVSKSFAGRQVLAELDLQIANGELICLLGPSGCGKTTLLRILAGFIAADAGSIRVAGQDVTKLAASARRMGMVFQSYSLFPNMTVADNVRFGPRVAGRPKAEQLARAGALLDLVGLSSHAGQYPHQLSGGQQQRVALARALAMQPQVLLLDEPLSALDPFLRIRMRTELRRLQRTLGITFIHVTHSQEEAMALSDLVVVMNGGRIEQAGPPRAVFNQPSSEFVARFIGGHNVITHQGRQIAVRTDRLALHPASATSASALRCTVTEVEYQGSFVQVALASDTGAELTAQIPEATFDAAPYAIGAAVLASWDATAAHPLG